MKYDILFIISSHLIVIISYIKLFFKTYAYLFNGIVRFSACAKLIGTIG